MLQTVSTAGTNLVISLFNKYIFISFDFTVFGFIFAEKSSCISQHLNLLKASKVPTELEVSEGGNRGLESYF